MAAAHVAGFELSVPSKRENGDAVPSDSGSDDSLDTAGAPAREAYEEYRSIDWRRESDLERSRVASLRSVKGLRGVTLRIVDASIPWLVTVSTGVCVGLVASYIDLTTAFLSGLREGCCPTNVFLGKKSCCAGLDAGEQCREFVTWSELLDLRGSASRAFLQYSVFLSLAVAFATAAALLVRQWGPSAWHSGIPEIKAILGGLILQAYLGPWTLLIKALGLSLAVASGLSLGKEGPMVHVACCIGNLIATRFDLFRTNEARRREALSAASAAGLAVAFSAPLGGVMFALEEASSYFSSRVLFHSFVCAVAATGVLATMDTSGSGSLVLFEAHSASGQVWRSFELLPWLFLGVCGGLFGHAFIQLNTTIHRFRMSTIIARYPIVEVALVSFATALISYLMPTLRVPTDGLVSDLFAACSALGEDTLGLRDRSLGNIFSLTVSAIVRTVLTAITFGMQIPAGVFLPAMAIGASAGRAVGLVFDAWQRRYPGFWLFASCPPEGAGCIAPSLYAVIGAASAVGGCTRLTLSLVVVFYELTAAAPLSMGLMISVLVAKFLADFLSRTGIYEAWIYLRGLVFLNPKLDFRSDGAVARDYMPPTQDLAVLEDEGWTLDSLGEFLRTESVRGFPIVRDRESLLLLGYISRDEVSRALRELERLPGADGSSPCRFFESSMRRRPSHLPHHHHDDVGGAGAPAGDGNPSTDGVLVLRRWVEDGPITLSAETAIEDVVRLFQRLGLRHVLLTTHGRLRGILTKSDIWRILAAEGSTSVRADLERERRGRRMRGSLDLDSVTDATASPTVVPRGPEESRLLDDMSVASSVHR